MCVLPGNRLAGLQSALQAVARAPVAVGARSVVRRAQLQRHARLSVQTARARRRNETGTRRLQRRSVRLHGVAGVCCLRACVLSNVLFCVARTRTLVSLLQARFDYFWFERIGWKQAKFTRLLATKDPWPITVPTHVAPPYNWGSDVYKAYNKPLSLMHWLQNAKPTEDIVIIVDPDCMFVRPFAMQDIVEEGKPIAMKALCKFISNSGFTPSYASIDHIQLFCFSFV